MIPVLDIDGLTASGLHGAPSDGLSAPDFERRFGGLARLYGAAGAARVWASHVAVVGIGGVGSWAAEALARSGVARLTLIDLDHVSESNINRQIHALDTTLGQAKVLAMRDRIRHINPRCDVVCIEAFVDAGNWPQLLGFAANSPGKSVDAVSAPDAIIDACDQVKAKVAMAVWARQTHALFISVGAAGGKRHAHLVDIGDLSAATHDPLLAQLRTRLRKEHSAPREGKSMGVPCVFSREAVMAPSVAGAEATDSTLNCHGYGSTVSVTATFGQCAAGWVLDKISSILPRA